METVSTNRRSIRSVSEALVIASGAVATAFGIAAATHGGLTNLSHLAGMVLRPRNGD